MKEITPNRTVGTGKKEQIRNLFDSLSVSYDKGNRFITFGMDGVWKKRLIRIVAKKNQGNILDLATGTGDLPIGFARRGLTNIIGLDLSAGMLEQARQRIDKENFNSAIKLVQGDTENLPFEEESFDIVTVSYGLRNYADLKLGLKETLRVLKSRGHFIILETSVPSRFPFKQGYTFFSKRIMPLIGGFLSGDRKAYKYLYASAMNFPCGQELTEILHEIGFKNVVIKPQFFGATTIYICEK